LLRNDQNDDGFKTELVAVCWILIQ